MGKSILHSKTFWVFLILAVGVVLNASLNLGLPMTEESQWVVLALSFVAFILRLFTGEQISWISAGDAKVFYKSKVFWIAVLIIVGSALNLTGWVKLPLDAESSWIAVALGVIAFILRLITKEPIVLENKEEY